MKKLLLFLFLIGILLQAQAQGQDSARFVINPETGRHDFLSRINPISDSVINYGTNNTISGDTLNGVIGHGNTVDADRALAIGYYNYVNQSENILFGSYLTSSVTHAVTIGRGWSSGNLLTNAKYGSIGLGYFSSVPILYVQSGYEEGEAYTADIGGVSIGGPELDTLTVLQINEHLPGDAFFLKCKKWVDFTLTDVFTVDYNGTAVLDGTAILDSVVCSYVPTIYQVAGDTSLYNTPVKIGDQLINTIAGDVYISVEAARGGWEKLN